ncbi:MAG: RNA methyltransferase [Flavobacteriaceae bacterium]|nr:RNA methyltransferase [Flavobacteriaceae bacterium]
MLTKNGIKLIKSLGVKKHRLQNNLFVVEGVKGVNEFLNSNFELEKLYCTIDFKHAIEYSKFEEITDSELNKISNLSSPNKAIALFKIPTYLEPKNTVFSLILDGINDPGNLGTIIRLCDWFGIKQLICSKDTVDCYNPKVTQATMGSLTRVDIHYCNLDSFIKNSKLPVYAALIHGENVYKTALPKKALLVMGNEANGISEPIQKLIKNQLNIPRFGNEQLTESLNVATATAILLSEFCRT